MNKKAQITWFILIGIIILIGGGFFIYLNSTRSDKEIEKVIVEECIKEVTPPGIYLLAAKGGYIYLFNNVLNTENIQIAYHLEYNTNISPERTFMEYELSQFVKESLPICINNFEPFNYLDFEIGEINVQSSISKEKIFVNVNYPITVITNDSKTVISEFTAEFPVRLGHILDIKDKILSNLLDTGMIGFDMLSSFDVELSLLPYDTETLVYSIYDESSVIDDVPFFFNFAVKIYGNSAPRLEFIPDFVLTKGKTFEYNLEAFDNDKDDVMRFYTENALIDMHESTGKFSFTPLVTGEYEIIVCVQDRYLAEDCDTMRFLIEDE